MEKLRAVKLSAFAFGLALLAVYASGLMGLAVPMPSKARPFAAHSRYALLVAEAKEFVPPIRVGELRRALVSDKRLRLIDVREDSEWAQGRIPGAVHLSKGLIERDIEASVPNVEDNIVLYCGNGGRGTLAAENLLRMGYRNVFNLVGGYAAWLEGGKEIVPANLAER